MTRRARSARGEPRPRPALILELKKAKDGRPSLACVRPDGSRTWAKVHPFFPLHDLTHCAVESVLGFDQAFYGLIAGGWELDDFSAPGASHRSPLQALWAEHVVGLLERGLGASAAELDAALTATLPPELAAGRPVVSDAQLAEIATLRLELAARWQALPPGETLSVAFPGRPVG